MCKQYAGVEISKNNTQPKKGHTSVSCVENIFTNACVAVGVAKSVGDCSAIWVRVGRAFWKR